MVGFDYYRNAYLGCRIPEAQFPSLSQQAEDILNRLKRRYGAAQAGQEETSLAVCAMAECLWEDHRRSHGIHTDGREAVAGRREPLGLQLYRKAAVYLDFYRGVN